VSRPSDETDAAVVEDEELPGLPGERTELAWNRVGISMVAVSAVILKRVVRGFDLESAAAIAIAIVIATAVAASALVVYAQTLADTRHATAGIESARRLRRVAYGTATFGVAAGLLALLPGPR
jgi:hypothetical protein